MSRYSIHTKSSNVYTKRMCGDTQSSNILNDVIPSQDIPHNDACID